jgi:hypothetical protein
MILTEIRIKMTVNKQSGRIRRLMSSENFFSKAVYNGNSTLLSS